MTDIYDPNAVIEAALATNRLLMDRVATLQSAADNREHHQTHAIKVARRDAYNEGYEAGEDYGRSVGWLDGYEAAKP